MKILFPEVVVVENLLLSLQEEQLFGTPNRLLSTAPRERIILFKI
jgi:hypothetical protein